MKTIWKAVALSLLFLAPGARAGEVEGARSVHSYGLLVGSNLPGENQEVLRFAHRDAERVGAVLSEIGDFDASNMTLLSDPDGETLRGALQEMEDIISEHHRRNEQTSFLFYYSGHARAHTLSLGNDELPLDEVREILEALPATVKVVILDACQAGAFSRVKGAGPASDFSHNSVTTLNTSGMAVMASSSASELSQESDRLGGSFFTHHLVVGLRGAADSDRNGWVTLHEAYRYAYNQTLVATAGTAVGKQHVTLETDLTGKGEMVLTKPAEATARLLLPAGLKADILVHRAADRTIVAEVHKAQGVEMGLAFPPDDYEVLVEQGKEVRRCSVRLSEEQTTTLNTSRCALLEKDPVGIKQAPKEAPQVVKQAPQEVPRRDKFRWLPFLELTGGGLVTHRDEFFTVSDEVGLPPRVKPYGGALVGVHVNRYFSFGLLYSLLDTIRGDDSITHQTITGEFYEWSQTMELSFHSHRFGLNARGTYPLLRDRLLPFFQLGAGGAVTKHRSRYTYSDEQDGGVLEGTTWGYALSVGAGLIGTVHRFFGLLVQCEYIYAPTIELIKYQEKHNSGGFSFSVGVRFTL